MFLFILVNGYTWMWWKPMTMFLFQPYGCNLNFNLWSSVKIFLSMPTSTWHCPSYSHLHNSTLQVTLYETWHHTLWYTLDTCIRVVYGNVWSSERTSKGHVLSWDSAMYAQNVSTILDSIINTIRVALYAPNVGTSSFTNTYGHWIRLWSASFG